MCWPDVNPTASQVPWLEICGSEALVGRWDIRCDPHTLHPNAATSLSGSHKALNRFLPGRDCIDLR